MKELSPGAKFILYEEVAARFPHYLSSNMHSKDKVSFKVILCRGISPVVSNLNYANLGSCNFKKVDLNSNFPPKLICLFLKYEL